MIPLDVLKGGEGVHPVVGMHQIHERNAAKLLRREAQRRNGGRVRLFEIALMIRHDLNVWRHLPDAGAGAELGPDPRLEVLGVLRQPGLVRLALRHVEKQ